MIVTVELTHLAEDCTVGLFLLAPESVAIRVKQYWLECFQSKDKKQVDSDSI